MPRDQRKENDIKYHELYLVKLLGEIFNVIGNIYENPELLENSIDKPE